MRSAAFSHHIGIAGIDRIAHQAGSGLAGIVRHFFGGAGGSGRFGRSHRPANLRGVVAFSSQSHRVWSARAFLVVLKSPPARTGCSGTVSTGPFGDCRRPLRFA